MPRVTKAQRAAANDWLNKQFAIAVQNLDKDTAYILAVLKRGLKALDDEKILKTIHKKLNTDFVITLPEFKALAKKPFRKTHTTRHKP